MANHRGTGPPERDGRTGPPVAGHRLGSGSPKRRTNPGGRAAHRVLRGRPGGRVPVSPGSALPGRARGPSGAGTVRPWTRHTACVVRDPAGGHRGPGRQPPVGGGWRLGSAVALRHASPDQSECAPPAGAGAACDSRQPGFGWVRYRAAGDRGSLGCPPPPDPAGRAVRAGRARRASAAYPAAVAFRPRTGGSAAATTAAGRGTVLLGPIPGGRGLPLSVPADRTGSGGQCGPSGRASRPPRPLS